MAFNKNIASQKIAVFAWDTVNNVPKTGDAAQITAYVDKDGAGAVQTNDVNPTEADATNLKGLYYFNMLPAETNADLITLSAVSSTSDILLDPVIIYTEGNIGTPIQLDSGTATLAGMLTKMADDNAGASFDATNDSLNRLQTAIVAGFPARETQSSGNITTGTETSGTVASTELDDGTYWQIAATTAVGGFGLNVDITFAVGTARTAVNVHVNAKETLTGVVLVWAYNYLTSAYEQISDLGTGISGNSDSDYVFVLLDRNQEVSTGDVKIRFTSTDTNAAKYLFLDRVFVDALVASALNPGEIAQAVWEFDLTSVLSTVLQAAGHVLEDTATLRGSIGTSDTNLSFTLGSGAPAIADALKGMTIEIEDAVDDHWEVRRIISYTNTRVVTVDRAYGFVPAVDDHYHLQSAGYSVVDINAIDGTAQRATDLAEIAQYFIANSATLTDIVADNSLIAQIMATGGDISDYSTTTDTQEAIADAIALLADLGSGAISVDHDTGGTDNLAYKTIAGAGIDNAVIRAYLKTDYDAGSKTNAFVKGVVTTTTTGRWSNTMRLDAGTYTFEFSKQGSFGPDTKEQAVS